MGLFTKLKGLLSLGRVKEEDSLSQALGQVTKEPGNPRPHLKLAEIYQKMGEKKKAISEYLLAAELFGKNNQYAEAMAIYKQVPKQDPSLDHVYLKIADIYRKMGFLGDAFAQYRILVNHYDKSGLKDKALEVMSLMAELDPRKIALEDKVQNFKEILKSQETERQEAPQPELPPAEAGEAKPFFDLSAELAREQPVELGPGKEVFSLDKVYGFEDIMRELKEISSPSKAYPDFNYQMGIACKEMGFLEEAISQFQAAVEKGQNSFAAAEMMGMCLKEMKRWEEASRAFERVLELEGVPLEKKLEVKYELGLAYKEQGKREEALKILREISATNREKLGSKGKNI